MGGSQPIRQKVAMVRERGLEKSEMWYEAESREVKSCLAKEPCCEFPKSLRGPKLVPSHCLAQPEQPPEELQPGVLWQGQRVHRERKRHRRAGVSWLVPSPPLPSLATAAVSASSETHYHPAAGTRALGTPLRHSLASPR